MSKHASIFDGRGRWPRRDAATTTTSRQRIDAHQVNRPFDGDQATLIVVTDDSRTSVKLRRTATANGGYRLDWLCPYCGRPARYLYGWPLACRRCHRLVYPSSQAHHDLAAWPMVRRKLAAVATRLHSSVDATRAPTRPARMHRRTYERLLDEWWQLRELDNALWLARFYGGLGRGMYESIGLDRDQVRPGLRTAGRVRQWRRRHETAWHKAAPRLPVR